MKATTLSVLAAAVLSIAAPAAFAESTIAFVNSDRVMREAAPAVRAQQRLQKEFEKREQELLRQEKELQAMQLELERNGVTMPQSDRVAKERTFNDLNREFQRKQRGFREDLNIRMNEERAAILERADRAVRQIAETEKIDVVLQEVVYFSARIDITDKVIKALADTK